MDFDVWASQYYNSRGIQFGPIERKCQSFPIATFESSSKTGSIEDLWKIH
jgi:hypothetical protein